MASYSSAGRGRAALAFGAVISLGLVACGESQAPDCGGLSVAEPWVRVAPEGADVMGAYFRLVNEGDAKVVVNGVNSNQFDRAEMHETVVNDDGQASMQPMAQVSVPAGETVAFEPGGRHVMLFSPSQTYAAGDQVELILSCGEQNAELPVPATVRAEKPQVPAGESAARGEQADQTAQQVMPADEAGAGTANADSASAE